AKLGADGERRGAEPRRRNRELQHLIEARRRLPLDGLFHELEIEAAVDERRQHADRAEELVDRHVDVLAVSRVEDDLLRVALDVADAKVIAEGLHAYRVRFTQAASAFHSGSSCELQCLPPGWNSVPPASCVSGIVSSRLFIGTPGRTTRAVAS